MSENRVTNLEEFLSSWKDNAKYFEMLGLMASLSRLFSENDTPYLDYRLAENLFCEYFHAINDARSCTAYDARISKLGIGIKTFILTGSDTSTEKIAEFNKLKPQLNGLRNIELARKLGQFRNDRIQFSNDTYNVQDRQYHIVGRKKGLLRVFNSPYDFVDIDKIQDVKENQSSIIFNDGINEYTFNKSKSVLMRRFVVCDDFQDVKVDILDNPLSILERLLTGRTPHGLSYKHPMEKGVNYVVLPLYSVRDKKVPEKSGLNQWNAGGRQRNEDEVYIPVPRIIHINYPDFFPNSKDDNFELELPDGTVLTAKLCQSGLKGLMSNPNSALGEWILRKVLRKAPGELVTMDDLNKFGIDSVIVEKISLKHYKISFSTDYENYESFIE